jgi:AraC-like DNA-binding protein
MKTVDSMGRRRKVYSSHSAYKHWRAMKRRCENPSQENYSRYGGRGIKICDRWKNFENFAADMGSPSEGLTLDRIDSNGNYEPENCRWLAKEEQSANRRSNHKINFKGETITLAELARRLGVSYFTVHSRITRLKWPIEKVIAGGKHGR